MLAAKVIAGLAVIAAGGCLAFGIAIGCALHNTAAAIVTYFALAALTSLLLIPAVARVGD